MVTTSYSSGTLEGECKCEKCDCYVFRHYDGTISDLGCGYDKHVCKSITKKPMSNIIERVKLALKSEPEKSLIKSGILNEAEELTSDGRTILEMLLVEDYKAKLKEKADIILAEEKD